MMLTSRHVSQMHVIKNNSWKVSRITADELCWSELRTCDKSSCIAQLSHF